MGSSLSCVELVSRLTMQLGGRGAWALMIAPEGASGAVADELRECWRFGVPPLDPVSITLEGDAVALLSRCRAATSDVFVVWMKSGPKQIAERIERERSRWLLARGGVLVAGRELAREFLRAAPNAASVLGANVVEWAPDPGLADAV